MLAFTESRDSNSLSADRLPLLLHLLMMEMDGRTRDKVSFLHHWRSRHFPLAHCVIERVWPMGHMKPSLPHDSLTQLSRPDLYCTHKWGGNQQTGVRTSAFGKCIYFDEHWDFRVGELTEHWKGFISEIHLTAAKGNLFLFLCTLKTQQATCFSLIITTWDKKQGRNFLCTKTCSTVLSHGACETLGCEAVSFDVLSLIQCCHEQAAIAIEEKAAVLPLSRAVISVRPVYQQRKMKRAHLTQKKKYLIKKKKKPVMLMGRQYQGNSCCEIVEQFRHFIWWRGAKYCTKWRTIFYGFN